ncbi:hypothetical protein [Streptomyces sp. NPDC057199]|uniref:hypothetical protein n=1 Tax=Streptomyces sp. NPDC057199 TaxID=3346047 RepID=UPI003625A7CF
MFCRVRLRRYTTSTQQDLRAWSLSWSEADPRRNAFEWDDDEEARITALVAGMTPSAETDADADADADRMKGFRFVGEVSVLLASRYGRWACGWGWSNYLGGPVGAWCCHMHSVGEAEETAARVVASLLEWRDWLEDMAERFEQLAPPPDANAEDRSWHLERAVTRLVTTVVDRTHAESAWYGLCDTTLTWFLSSTGLRPEAAREAVEAAIGGRFKSWAEPAPPLVDAVGEDLAVRLTGRGFYRER